MGSAPPPELPALPALGSSKDTLGVVSASKAKDPAKAAGQRQPRLEAIVGTLLHTIIESELSQRLAARGVTHATELKTKPDGAKSMSSESSGRIDLTLFEDDPRAPGSSVAHIYDIKPDNPAEYQRYVSEVDHYTDYFPDQVDGAAVRPPRATLHISNKVIGDKLRALAAADPALLAPIVLTDGQTKITIEIKLPAKPWGGPIDGLIVYQFKPDRNQVQRAVEMLRTTPFRTAKSQARNQFAGSVALTLGAIGATGIAATVIYVGAAGAAAATAGAGATAGATATAGAVGWRAVTLGAAARTAPVAGGLAREVATAARHLIGLQRAGLIPAP